MVPKNVLLFLSLTSTVLCRSSLYEDGEVVAIKNGLIRGRTVQTRNNVTFYAFQEVPFAQPPLGELRFQAPRPSKDWEGVLNCTRNTKICMQLNSDVDLENEDCLYLNVYTPVKPGSNASLPVLYYIYGGGFITGESTFDTNGPHFFIDQNIIVVTVMYRVGPWGFLSTADDVIPGNHGLKDQNLGLKWVRDNIEAFGGDPNLVTIMGQSAGSASVTYQILSKNSAGLFRGAIAESGSALNPFAYQKDARNIAFRVGKLLNPLVDFQNDSEKLKEYLLQATSDEIDRAASSIKDTGDYNQTIQGFYFAPVIESEQEGAFLTERQFELVSSGELNKVPILMGITSEESLENLKDGLEAFKTKICILEADPKTLVNLNMHIEDTEDRRECGKELRSIYTDTFLAANLSNGVRYLSDMMITHSVIKFAELQSQYTEVYFYQFSYSGKLGNNSFPKLDGVGKVYHAEDMNYLWARLGNDSKIYDFPDKDQEVSGYFVTFVSNFVKSLNPTPEPVGGVTWPLVEENNFQYVDIDEKLEIRLNPKELTYRKWDDLYRRRAVLPLYTY